jgi:hypothetical protein
MNFVTHFLCFVIFTTFSAQVYSAETFSVMENYGTQEAYEAEEAHKAQAELMTQENIKRGVENYKKGIRRILKRSDKRIGKIFLKKENMESLQKANLDTSSKEALGKQVRVLLEKELKRDLASEVDIQSSFVKDFEHKIANKARSGFGRVMCYVGRIAMGVVGVALIGALFIGLMAAGFAQSAGILLAAMGVGMVGLLGSFWMVQQGFTDLKTRCE